MNPIKSPFKFLDSFTKEDKEIFFGRDKETEELYQKNFRNTIINLKHVITLTIFALIWSTQ